VVKAPVGGKGVYRTSWGGISGERARDWGGGRKTSALGAWKAAGGEMAGAGKKERGGCAPTVISAGQENWRTRKDCKRVDGVRKGGGYQRKRGGRELSEVTGWKGSSEAYISTQCDGYGGESALLRRRGRR